jgi:hypothetical protein
MGTSFTGIKTLSGIKVADPAPTNVSPVFTDPTYDPAGGGAAGTLVAEFLENSSVNFQLHATNAQSFSIMGNAGALPGGVSMSSAGLFTGTAPNVTQTTSYTFMVRASNGGLNTDKLITIDVINV